VTRRKGERPIAVHLDTWSADRPVAQAIAPGSGWLDAWLGEKDTPIGRLSKLKGIPGGRLLTIAQGDRVSRTEIDALARAWSISSNALLASLPDSTCVVE
jgi:hypothetical protein